VSAAQCEAIAKARRKLQRISPSRILFLDETAVRISEAPGRTLVLPGEEPIIEATDTSSCARRYDMIACCTGKEVLLPKIFTPKERASADVRGINKAMLQQFIDDSLAQAVEGLDRYPLILVLDKAPTHTGDLLQSFHDRSSYSITEVALMPTASAKRLSPLDNSLFHDWKERVRKRAPLTDSNITQVMADEWNALPPELLRAHYKHSGLTRGTDVYFDCPAPAVHKHHT
jgi:hypothetical protein